MPRLSRTVYLLIGGNLALDFVNTIHTVDLPDPQDEWRSTGDVIAWARLAGALSKAECQELSRVAADNPRIAGLLLRRARTLRGLIYEIFVAIVTRGWAPRPLLVRFNQFFSEIMWRTEIVRTEDGYVVAPVAGLDPASKLFGAVVKAAGELLTSPDVRRVRQCGDAYCSWLFVDRSRTGRRRWCSMLLCGNRARVRAFRRRRAR